jgi:predicted TIM-barrel fold metal-dependent hydrolase
LFGAFASLPADGPEQALTELVFALDERRALFGADWPAAPESTVVRNIANLTSFGGFTAEDLRRVERDNALRLFPRFT